MAKNIQYTPATAQMLTTLFAQLDAHWQGERDGMLRPGYSEREQEAFEIVTRLAIAQGQDVYEDAMGNRIFLTPGLATSLPIALGGSHLDAVPKGGRYDGPAGVAARMAATHMLNEAGFMPVRGYAAIAFRNEESPWFGDYAVGSKLATAQLPASFLDKPRKDSGRTLADHMGELCIDAAAAAKHLRDGTKALPVDRIHSFHEVHIEQGPLLTRGGYDVGIVNGIRGNVRFVNDAKVVFNGVAGHTGAVPGLERADAVAMGAEFVSAVRRKILAWNKQGRDGVVAFPIAKTAAYANPTTIPDYYEVTVEVRSLDVNVLKDAQAMIVKAANKAAGAHGGQANIERNKIVFNNPALMSTDLIAAMQDFTADAGIKSAVMPSGAGHDAAVLAWSGVDCIMTFVAHGNNGASHRPDEILGLTPEADPFAVGSCFAKAVMLDAMHIVRTCGDTQALSVASGTSFVEALLARGGRVIYKQARALAAMPKATV